MLRPARLVSDPDYLAFHRRALESGRSSTGPVVVQVCGNDQDVIVRGAKTVVDLCDGIGTYGRGGLLLRERIIRQFAEKKNCSVSPPSDDHARYYYYFPPCEVTQI
jgi:hypothetical protein